MNVYNFSREFCEDLMRIVMDEVDIAISEGNAPFAAILIDKDGNIIDKAHNTSNSLNIPIMHAEINLLMSVCKKNNTINLSNYCLVSNAWSCSMCMSASVKSRISNFIFGAPSEEKMNPNITVFDVADNSSIKLNIVTGILESECREQIMRGRSISK